MRWMVVAAVVGFPRLAIALNGTASFPDSSCSAAERTRLANAMATLRSAFVDNPGSIGTCMREAYAAGPNTSDQNGLGTVWTDWLMYRLAENMPTKFYCSETLPGGSFGSAAAGLSFTEEVVLMTHASLHVSVSDEQVAALLTHEIVHTKGGDHGIMDGIETASTSPHLASYCFAQRAQAMPIDTQGGPPRSSQAQEMRQSPVGQFRGDSFEAACPGKTVAAGIFGHESTANLERVGLTCKPPGVDSQEQDTQAFGSWVGTSFRQRCYPNEVVVGLWGYADYTIEAAGPMCASQMNVNTSLTPTYNDQIHGTARGISWQRRCPLGMVVKALRGRTEGWGSGKVNQLEVTCQSLDNSQHIARWSLPSVGNGNNYGWANREVCAGRSAMIAINVVTDAAGLTRIAGWCKHVTTAAATQSLSGWSQLLPGYGGMWTGHTGDYCPENQVLVGLVVYTPAGGGNINAVGGRCAPIASWTSSQASSIKELPVRGVTSGSATFQTCPQPYVMDGFYAQTNARVNSLAVQCRAFNGYGDAP